MNTSRTDNGKAYEYDRTKLKEHIDSHWGEQRIDRNTIGISCANCGGFGPYDPSAPPHQLVCLALDRNSDLIGMAYVLREFLEEAYKDRARRLKREWTRFYLCVLVFAGVVLWKVWVR